MLTVARWRRRAEENSVGCLAENLKRLTYQTKHLEQLPGVNYIMSLRDRKASKRGCCVR